MITTHYVCCSTKSEQWSYKKAKKRLFEVLITSDGKSILSDIGYILYHCSCKNGKKIAKITKTFGYKFIEFTG